MVREKSLSRNRAMRTRHEGFLFIHSFTRPYCALCEALGIWWQMSFTPALREHMVQGEREAGKSSYSPVC